MRNLVLLTVCGLVAAPLAAYAQDLPPGPGADITTRVCTSCHGTGEISSEQHDADGWANVVSQMVAQGANATDAEQTQIINYLAATFPRGGAAPAPAAPPASAGSGATPSTPAATPPAAPAPATPPASAGSGAMSSTPATPPAASNSSAFPPAPGATPLPPAAPAQ